MDALEKLVQKLEKETRKTEDFFSALPEKVWERQLYADGQQWSVRQVLAHIVETEGSKLRLFENIRDGGVGVSNKFDIDDHNAREVAKLDHLSPSDLLQAFLERRKEVINFVRSLSPEMLASQEGTDPFLGQASLAEMLRIHYMHVNLHIRDIRKLI